MAKSSTKFGYSVPKAGARTTAKRKKPTTRSAASTTRTRAATSTRKKATAKKKNPCQGKPTVSRMRAALSNIEQGVETRRDFTVLRAWAKDDADYYADAAARGYTEEVLAEFTGWRNRGCPTEEPPTRTTRTTRLPRWASQAGDIRGAPRDVQVRGDGQTWADYYADLFRGLPLNPTDS